MAGTVRAPRRRSVKGHRLVAQLGAMVAELISENRKLKRQVAKLNASGSALVSSATDRSLRTIQRRLERALVKPKRRRRRTVSSNSRTLRGRRVAKAPS
jgi:hypothetical protein